MSTTKKKVSKPSKKVLKEKEFIYEENLECTLTIKIYKEGHTISVVGDLNPSSAICALEVTKAAFIDKIRGRNA